MISHAPLSQDPDPAQPSPSNWAEIVQLLGAEISEPLSLALDHVQTLLTTGQIDRQSLASLRDKVAKAREAGMVAQQLARLASGRLRLARDLLPLGQVLQGVLNHRAREAQARGVQIRQVIAPLEIHGDGALLFALLNALMDWALASTHSSIELRLEMGHWPARARLLCRFAHRALDLIEAEPRDGAGSQRSADSLSWRLVEQTALTLGALVRREDEAGIAVLILEFPHTVLPRNETRAAPAPSAPREFKPSGNSKPLAGSHVLMVSLRHDWRMQVLDAIRHMGLIVDHVGGVDDAALFCEAGLPHAIVFEHAQRGEALEELRRTLLKDLPGFSFIEIYDDDHMTQLSTATLDGVARLSRKNLADALPAMLMFELTKGL